MSGSCRVFFSSRRRHTRFKCDWSSDVCSSDLKGQCGGARRRPGLVMQIEPGAAVVPVLAAGRYHHLVGTDFAHVVIIVLRIVQHGIHGREKCEEATWIAAAAVM